MDTTFYEILHVSDTKIFHINEAHISARKLFIIVAADAIGPNSADPSSGILLSPSWISFLYDYFVGKDKIQTVDESLDPPRPSCLSWYVS